MRWLSGKFKKKKKNYKFDDSYLLLFVYTLSTTITIKKNQVPSLYT